MQTVGLLMSVVLNVEGNISVKHMFHGWLDAFVVKYTDDLLILSKRPEMALTTIRFFLRLNKKICFRL